MCQSVSGGQECTESCEQSYEEAQNNVEEHF